MRCTLRIMKLLVLFVDLLTAVCRSSFRCFCSHLCSSLNSRTSIKSFKSFPVVEKLICTKAQLWQDIHIQKMWAFTRVVHYAASYVWYSVLIFIRSSLELFLL